MHFTKEGFIGAFRSLSDGNNQKEANTYLLELQRSDKAWDIAVQLLNDHDQGVKLYGATMIKKKLSDVEDTRKEQLIQFLVTRAIENTTNRTLCSQLCSCIAKLLVNSKQSMAQFVLSLSQTGNEYIQLLVLKELPTSLCFSTKSILQGKNQGVDLFSAVTPLLIRSWAGHANLVLEIIQSFMQFCQIDILASKELLRNLMSLPIQKTQAIIYDYLANNDRENEQVIVVLSAYILAPLNQTQTPCHQTYISLYIQFCRHLISVKMSLQDFSHVLYNMLRLTGGKSSLIVDSMEFWMEVTQKFHEGALGKEESVLLRNALLTLIELTVQFSTLKKLIPRNQIVKIINIDEEDFEDLSLYRPDEQKWNNDQNYAMDFRQYAEDIFRLSYRVLRQFPQTLETFHGNLHQIVTKGHLELQLVIFVLKSIIDLIQTPEQQQSVSKIVCLLVDHFDSLPKEILIPLTQLLYECQYIFISNIPLTQKCLSVFLKMLNQKSASRLLSQTIQSIVETVCNNQSNTKPMFQQFISLLYSQIVSIDDDVVRDSIFGSVIMLISHQNNPSQSYRGFLDSLTQKITGIQPGKQFSILYSLIQIHFLKIKTTELNQDFAKFLRNLLPLISNLYNHSKNEDKTKLVFAITKCSKLCGQQIPQTMVSLCRLFLADTLATDSGISFAIQFLSVIVTFYQFSPDAYSHLLQEVYPSVAWRAQRDDSPEVLKAYIKLLQSLGEARYNVNYEGVVNLIHKILTLPLNYELAKGLLKYFIWLVRNRIIVDQVLSETLKHYNKLSEMFHQQLMTIFFECFKVAGEQPIRRGLEANFPQLLPPNPLYLSLIDSIRSSNSVDVKNILLCLDK